MLLSPCVPASLPVLPSHCDFSAPLVCSLLERILAALSPSQLVEAAAGGPGGQGLGLPATLMIFGDIE